VKIQDIKGASGSRRGPKRVGRGIGSGHGKTSTKGHKGQKARSGGGKGAGFEGGQMPLQRRLPKRGFKNPFPKQYVVFNLRDIERLGLEAVSPEVLRDKGVYSPSRGALKILGEGELTRAVSVRANAFSASAAKKIEQAGGTAEVV
jgi:large subunit ribosomal protein L15